MKNLFLLRLFVGFLMLLGSYSALALEAVPGEYIVKYKEGANYKVLGKASLKHNLRVKRAWGSINTYHFKSKAKDNNPSEGDFVLEELKNNPDVLYAEPNYIVYSSSTSYEQTSAPIFAPESWELTSKERGGDSKSTVVAVIDSGVNVNHEIFKDTGRLWENLKEKNGKKGVDDDGNGFIDDINGWNFLHDNNNLTDSSDKSSSSFSHGMHVAGIVIGATEMYKNRLDLTQAPRVKIMPIKFMENGKGKTSDAINAIYYALENGAKIMNNSWGAPSYSRSLHEAVVYSYFEGALFVAAAGNDGTNNDVIPIYPAGYDTPNVVSVGATYDNDRIAFFSNFGQGAVDLFAPGYAISSAYHDGGMFLSNGTSMAAPFVSGLAALLLREAPQFTGYQLKEDILTSVDSFRDLEDKAATSGRVNFKNAVLKTLDHATDQSYLPEYNPQYYASRELASLNSMEGIGCGRVNSAMVKHNQSLKSGKVSLTSFIVFILLLIPVLSVINLRVRLNRRKHERVSVNYLATLVDGSGNTFQARVIDFSLGGALAKLEGDSLKEMISDDHVTLKFADAKKSNSEFECSIARKSNGQLGLKFIRQNHSQKAS